ncbi:MAG: hypothetical protein V1859_05215 [archaeon]
MKKLFAFLLCFLLISCTQTHIVNKSGSNPLASEYDKSISLAAEWFLNNQNNNFLYYEYIPSTKTHSAQGHQLRELGALWSITEYYIYSNDSRYEKLSLKGLNYFLARKTKSSTGYYYYSSSEVKLGYSAFIILSLLNIDYNDKDELMHGFAKGILENQNFDGSFNTFFFSDRGSGTDYYPGEALLALISLYEYSGKKEYLSAVENSFPYYRDYFRKNKNTAFVPWQSRALTKLYYITKNRKYADFVFEMNDYMVNYYSITKGSCDSFRMPGSVIAVHSEGVVQAYNIATELRDTKRAECYSKFIKSAANYTISLQVLQTEDIYSIGGIKSTLSNNAMRVDRNQHALLMLMDAKKAGII